MRRSIKPLLLVHYIGQLHVSYSRINSGLAFLTWYSAIGLMAGFSRIVIQMLSRWCSSFFVNASPVTSRCRIRRQYPARTFIGFPVPARVYRAFLMEVYKPCRSRSANPNLFAATRLGIFKNLDGSSKSKVRPPIYTIKDRHADMSPSPAAWMC